MCACVGGWVCVCTGSFCLKMRVSLCRVLCPDLPYHLSPSLPGYDGRLAARVLLSFSALSCLSQSTNHSTRHRAALYKAEQHGGWDTTPSNICLKVPQMPCEGSYVHLCKTSLGPKWSHCHETRADIEKIRFRRWSDMWCILILGSTF